MRAYSIAAVLLASAVSGFVLLSGSRTGAFDFQAFYCAGAAARTHADPYRTQPLGACEHEQTRGSYAQLPAGVVLPAPQPGYDIAAFALLSLLPFDDAKALWGALLAIALAAAVLTTARAARSATMTTVMAFASSLVFPTFAFGEMFAFFAAGAGAAMLFASRGRWSAAGFAAAATLVEPHLGLPVCLSLAICKPRTRVPLAAGTLLLGAIAFAVLGAGPNLEYVRSVLPLHALAEISSDAQLGLSAVLHALGTADRIAVIAGAASYLAFAVLGIGLGRALAKRTGESAFVVAVPAAFATFGGTFMHATEVFAAIPLALLLAAVPSRSRWIAYATPALLAVPWYVALERGGTAAFAILGAIAVFYLLWQREPKRLLLSAAAGAAAFVLLYTAPSFAQSGQTRTRAPQRIADTSYPQASWQRWTYGNVSSGSAISWVLRGLSWSGLLLLGTGTVLLVRDPNGLLVDEFVNPQIGKFPAVAAAFDTAER